MATFVRPAVWSRSMALTVSGWMAYGRFITPVRLSRWCTVHSLIPYFRAMARTGILAA
ncbi:hypothetical protein QE416_001068 [Microbacterium sp. SORGH_AS 421]|nr:hypothetical protein [Microbacterium sp. SORGH_AS_0421]